MSHHQAGAVARAVDAASAAIGGDVVNYRGLNLTDARNSAAGNALAAGEFKAQGQRYLLRARAAEANVHTLTEEAIASVAVLDGVRHGHAQLRAELDALHMIMSVCEEELGLGSKAKLEDKWISIMTHLKDTLGDLPRVEAPLVVAPAAAVGGAGELKASDAKLGIMVVADDEA